LRLCEKLMKLRWKMTAFAAAIVAISFSLAFMEGANLALAGQNEIER